MAAQYGRYLQNISLQDASIKEVMFIQSDMNVMVTVEVNNTGIPRSRAMLHIRISVQIASGVFAQADLTDFGVEVRDSRLPRIITIAPSESAALQGSLVLAGVVSLPRLSYAQTQNASCTLVLGSQSFPATVFGVVSLESWIQPTNPIQTLFPKPEVLALTDGISDELASYYQIANSNLSNAAVQLNSNQTIMVVLQMPVINFQPNVKNSSVEADLQLRVGGVVLLGKVSLLKDPDGFANAFAQTQNNDLKSDLNGNVRLFITLTNFAAVCKASDIRVEFEANQVPIQQLFWSGRDATKLVVIVPPSPMAKKINISVYPVRNSRNRAVFQFEYFDPSIVPIVTWFSPYQVYSSPGGTKMDVQVSSLPNVPFNSVFVMIQVENTTLPNISPLSLVYSPQTSSLSFLSPNSAIAGKSRFWILIPSYSLISSPVQFEMFKIPSTPAQVLSFSPSFGMSSGRALVLATLVNIKMCSQGDILKANITLKNRWAVQNCSVVDSTILRTTLTFIPPSFEFGGIASIVIWAVGAEARAASREFLFVDASFPELIYAYPSNGVAGKKISVEVSVARFGDVLDFDKGQLLFNQNMNGSIIGVHAGQNSISVFQLSLFCPINGPYRVENMTIKQCLKSVSSQCKSISFNFECMDPFQPSIAYFDPTSVYTDGNTPMQVRMLLPAAHPQITRFVIQFFNPVYNHTAVVPAMDIQSGNMLIYDPSKDTSAASSNGEGISVDNIVFTFLIPEALKRTPVDNVVLSAKWFYSSSLVEQSLDFPSKFSYSSSPFPKVVSCIPTQAFKDTPTSVTLFVKNFPGIHQASDISVSFYFQQNLRSVSAEVLSFTRQDQSVYMYAIQDVVIAIKTPQLLNLSIGLSQVQVFHSNYPERVASTGSFLFMDSKAAEVQGISSETGETGIKSLRIRKSAKTQITVVVGGSQAKPVSIVLGGGQVDVSFSEYDGLTGISRAVFLAPSSTCADPCPPLYGLITFSRQCVGCSDASCCQTESCVEKCGLSCSSAACFSLEYFDDTMPKILFQSVSEGPSSGGTVIQMKISGFPMVKAGAAGASGAVAQFLAAGIEGRVTISVSGTDETDLTIVTPSVETNGPAVTFLSNTLASATRPDKYVQFPFKFQPAITSLVFVSPTTGVKTGNVYVSLTIANFPFPADIGIIFGNVEVPQDKIRLWPVSSSLRTVIGFSTLASAIAGPIGCRVYPKTCPQACGQAVTFQFNQIESIAFLEPAPALSVLSNPPPVLSVRLSNVPEDTDFLIQFVDAQGSNPFFEKITLRESLSNVTRLSFPPPRVVGRFDCNILVMSPGNNMTLSFAHQVFPPNQIRIISVSPSTACTQFKLYGHGTLRPRTQVSVVVSNFPGSVRLKDMFVGFQGGFQGSVISVDDISFCGTARDVDCNRTRIAIMAPSLIAPGIVSGEISWSNTLMSVDPQQSSSATSESRPTFTISYFFPCDYESFCGSNLLVADVQSILQNPPSSSVCEVKYCIDPAKLADPDLISIFPTEGPALGGTTVELVLKNFPIITIQSIMVVIGSGNLQQQIPASILSENTESNVVTLSFVTLRVPAVATHVLADVACAVVAHVGPTKKQASFSFQYTPVASGRAIVTRVYPSLIRSTIPTSVFVQMQNFPKIELSAFQKVIAKLTCNDKTDFSATSVVQSSYFSSTVIFSLVSNATGDCSAQIYWKDSGLDRAGVAGLTFTPIPTPMLQSCFPSQALRSQVLSCVILNFDPQSSFKDFKVSISGNDLFIPVLSASSSSVANCTVPECSKFSVQFKIPEDLADNGDTIILTVTIAAKGLSATTAIPVSSSLSPRVQSVVPNSLLLTEASSSDILVYIGNAGSFCRDISSCTAAFGGRKGLIRSSATRGSLLVLTLRAPVIPDDRAISCTVAGNGREIEFCRPAFDGGLIFLPSPLEIRPVDCPCAGGATVTITAVGYSSLATGTFDANVFFGFKAGLDLALLYANTSGHGLSTVSFSVSFPVFEAASDSIASYVLMKGSRIDFPIYFECFDPPVLVISPSSATLDSAGGKSTTLTLNSFPQISQLEDIVLTFGSAVCDGTRCGIVAFKNAIASVQLTVTLPRVKSPETVDASIVYQGPSALPAGGDFGKLYTRSPRRVSAKFSFVSSTPVVVSALFCAVCNAGPSCIVNGRCGGLQEPPRSNVMARSGAGALVLIVNNIPQIPFNESSGAVVQPALATVQFGGIYADIKRVLYSDPFQLSLEISLPGAISFDAVDAFITVQPDVESPLVSSANFYVQFYSDEIQIACLESPCAGPSTRGIDFRVSISGMVLTAKLLTDTITVRFNDVLAAGVEFLGEADSKSTMRVTPPDYACNNCAYSSGAANVNVRFLNNIDSKEFARLPYTFWSPPSIVSASFDISGSSILVTFDQATNRALMTPASTDCSLLFTSSEFGSGPSCVWNSNTHTTIFLGKDASIVPGSIVAVNADANLKSLNGVSHASSAQAIVYSPSKAFAVISLTGATTIDVCSPLELRAFVLSPRPVRFNWNCLSDPDLDAYLVSLSGPTLKLDAGTPEMKYVDKSYFIVVSSTDFLGSVSKKLVLEVVKRSSPVPQVQFVPPTLSTTKDKAVVIKGQTTFSSCPVSQDQLVFYWSLIGGPFNSAIGEALSTESPQLYLAPNSLEAGASYIFSLRCTMGNDTSRITEAQFLLSVGLQRLVAVIDGGSSLRIASSEPLVLSAAGSQDPDTASRNAQNKSFEYAWSCATLTTGINVPCRDVHGRLMILPNLAQIVIAGGTLQPTEAPYLFQLTISKIGKMPARAVTEVFVQLEDIPSIDFSLKCFRDSFSQLPCCRRTDGSIVASVESKFTAIASSNKPNTSFEWSLSTDETLSSVNAPIGYISSSFVLQGSADLFAPGNTYQLRLRGDAGGSSNFVTSGFVINSSPIGGLFSACLLSAPVGCVKTGLSIIDVFRLSCSQWADPEGSVALSFRFGYMYTVSSSSPAEDSSNHTDQVWFDWGPDNIKDLSLPAGEIVVMAQVQDDCGGLTEVLFDNLNIVDGATAVLNRRLLAAANFWDIAKAKVKTALQAFRPDDTNQLSSALALEAAKLSAGSFDAVTLKETLMNSLAVSASRGLKTTGFVCEAFGAAAQISKRPADLSRPALVVGSNLFEGLTFQSVDGNSVPKECENNAVLFIGNLFLALSRNSSSEDSDLESSLLRTISTSLNSLLRRMLTGAVAGESRSILSALQSSTSVLRSHVGDIQATLSRRGFPVLVPGTNALRAAKITISDPFLGFLSALNNDLVDVVIQSHMFAPMGSQQEIVSSLFQVSLVSLASGGQTFTVLDLSTPLFITVPTNVQKDQHDLGLSNFKCLSWNSTYKNTGCSVHALEAMVSGGISVTCACSKLTMLIITLEKVSNISADQMNATGNSSADSLKPVKGGFKIWPFGSLDPTPSRTPVSNGGTVDLNGRGDSNGSVSPIAAYVAASMAFLALLIIFFMLHVVRFICRRKIMKDPDIKILDDKSLKSDMVFLPENTVDTCEKVIW